MQPNIARLRLASAGPAAAIPDRETANVLHLPTASRLSNRCFSPGIRKGQAASPGGDMETGQCIVDRSVKLDAVDSSTLDGGGADLDNIDVERILERACYTARRRLPLYQAPEFTKRLKTLESVRTGEKVHFECHWTAFPRPAVKWYHDDEEISNDDDRFEIESLRRGVLKLTLKSATKADEGSYKCKAENQEGVTSTTGYLSVTGDSRKSRSKESRRKRQRAVSLPPHLRTITEQRSLEEREEVACSRQPRSPIQDFIDNIETFRKDHTWPLLSRHHGADDKRKATTQKWNDHADSGAETAVDGGAVGGKSSFERVLDNCENPFAKRPLLPYSDDRVTSEGDLTPNGRDMSSASRPTSLKLAAGTGRNASDTCGRVPGRVVFPHPKKYKPVVVADVAAALKANAGEHAPLPAARKTVSPRRPTSPQKKAEAADGKQRGRVSSVSTRHAGDSKKPDVVRLGPSKEKVYARISGLLCEDKSVDSGKAPSAGLIDAIADSELQVLAAPDSQPADVSESTAPPSLVDSDDAPVRPESDSNDESSVRQKIELNESSLSRKPESKEPVCPEPESNESSLRPKSESTVCPENKSNESAVFPKPETNGWSVRLKPDSSESPVRQKPVSIVSPVGQLLDSDDPSACTVTVPAETERDVSASSMPAAVPASAVDEAKALLETYTIVTPTTPTAKADRQRPVWLYFVLFVTCCAFVGCSLRSYPANFIFVVTLLSMISFRLLLRREDFLGKS